MAEEKKDSKSIVIIILIIVIVLLLIAGAVGITYFLTKRSQPAVTDPVVTVSDKQDSSSQKNDSVPKLEYENGAVILDEDSMQKAYDDMLEKTKDGQMTLSFKNQAISSDGVNFECHIENAPDNKPDMYITIYKDNTLSEMLYLSGLIRPGTGIDHFKSEIKLEPGNYTSVLVLTQVDDDHQTMKGTLSVTLELKVGS